MEGPCGRKRLYIWCKGETILGGFSFIIHIITFDFSRYNYVDYLEVWPRGELELM